MSGLCFAFRGSSRTSPQGSHRRRPFSAGESGFGRRCCPRPRFSPEQFMAEAKVKFHIPPPQRSSTRSAGVSSPHSPRQPQAHSHSPAGAGPCGAPRRTPLWEQRRGGEGGGEAGDPPHPLPAPSDPPVPRVAWGYRASAEPGSGRLR